MKTSHVTRLFLALGLLASGPSCDRKPESEGATPSRATGQPCDNWISGAEARKIVSAGGLLLDVRTPAEFVQGHLDGSLNIEVDELSSRLSELPQDKHLVVYCRSGKRAHRAALLLAEKGYKVSEIGTQEQYDPSAPSGCQN